jgi:hypothetical protein
MVRKSVAEILQNHVIFELEAIDRMYLNALKVRCPEALREPSLESTACGLDSCEQDRHRPAGGFLPVTKTRMSERTATVAGVLTVSMFIGCSYERNIEKQRKHGRRSNRMPAGSITSSRTSPRVLGQPLSAFIR